MRHYQHKIKYMKNRNFDTNEHYKRFLHKKAFKNYYAPAHFIMGVWYKMPIDKYIALFTKIPTN